jgi:Uma2 family endonuclease
MATTPALEAADAGELRVVHDVIDGRRVERRVSVRSALIAGELNVALREAARATGAGRTFPSDAGYEIFGEPNPLKFADVSFVRAERLTQEELRRTFLQVPPDIAAEVVSPSDRAYDVEAKARDWIRAGARLVWVLFPETQTVHVYRADGRDEILGPEDTLTGEDVLPGFRAEVRDLLPGELSPA